MATFVLSPKIGTVTIAFSEGIFWGGQYFSIDEYKSNETEYKSIEVGYKSIELIHK
jgi:hypothetical protein